MQKQLTLKSSSPWQCYFHRLNPCI